MTYDQQCDEGQARSRSEQLARAEAIINEVRASDDADLIAQGEICRECGERFQVRQGAPSACRDCGGAAPAGNSWFAEGQYYANQADAEFWRKAAAEKRKRLQARILRNLPSAPRFEITEAGRFALTQTDARR